MSFNSDGRLQDFRQQLSKYFSKVDFLESPLHYIDYMQPQEEEEFRATWRLVDRMKVTGALLVVCLNVGTDPPDVFRPSPCARRECWFDPLSAPKQKALETIGNSLQEQYKKWQPKITYKAALDPTSEELRRVCTSLRKAAKSDRLLLHYNGHGVPMPTDNGELWVFGKNYTHYMPLSISDLRSWIGDPTVYIIDCCGAGKMIPYLTENRFHHHNHSTNDTSDIDNFHAPNLPHFDAAPFSGASQSASLNISIHSTHSQSSHGANSTSRMQTSTNIVLAACKGDEQLPLNPLYPADLFTSALTTPIQTAVRWFILQNGYSMSDVDLEFSENIPGEDKNRKSPLGELNWIFTTVTDTIAWSSLPWSVFQKLFREDLLVSSLFRNFLLARRIMKALNCTPQSYPNLPDTSSHPLWHSWDLAVESVVVNVLASQRTGTQPHTAPSSIASTFFAEQLTAFEIWLDFHSSRRRQSAVGREWGRRRRYGSFEESAGEVAGQGAESGDGKHETENEVPIHLPILLQVLLSQTHRVRALLLLRRYLSLGADAVNMALLVGIFPYILKLLHCPAADIKQILVHIWASILGFDPSGRVELVREKLHKYFISHISSPEIGSAQRCMCAFVLAQICNGFREGQEACLQLGLHRTCCSLLALSTADTNQISPALKKWTALCLAKLCEDFVWAKYLCLTEAGHTQLYPLLVDPEPHIRAAAVLALGEFLGASASGLGPLKSSHNNAGSGNGSGPSQHSPLLVTNTHSILELRQVELQLAVQLLESCSDACALVRLEAAIALARFFQLPAHFPCIRLVVSTLITQERYTRSQGQRTFQKSKLPYPWMLTPSNASRVVRQVRQLIENQGFSTPSSALNGDYGSPLATSMSPQFFRGALNGSGGGGSFQNNQQAESAGSLGSNGHMRYEQPSLDLSLGYGAVPVTGVLSTASAMAPAYVRLWLALKEVEHKDPHVLVERAITLAIHRIEEQVVASDLERDRRTRAESSRSNSEDVGTASGSQGTATGSAATLGSSSRNGDRDRLSLDSAEGVHGGDVVVGRVQGHSSMFHFPGLGGDVATNSNGRGSPWGSSPSLLGGYGDRDGNGNGAHHSPGHRDQSHNQISHGQSHHSNVIHRQSTATATAAYVNQSTPAHHPPLHPNMNGGSNTWTNNNSGGGNGQQDFSGSGHQHHGHNHSQGGLPAGEAEIDPLNGLIEYDGQRGDQVLKSTFYDRSRQQFLAPVDSAATDPMTDPLSDTAVTLQLREERRRDILESVSYVAESFRSALGMVPVSDQDDLGDPYNGGLDNSLSGSLHSNNQNQSNGTQSQNSLPRLEQKATLHVEGAQDPSSVLLFHAFRNILAISSHRGVDIWSLASGNRLRRVTLGSQALTSDPLSGKGNGRDPPITVGTLDASGHRPTLRNLDSSGHRSVRGEVLVNPLDTSGHRSLESSMHRSAAGSLQAQRQGKGSFDRTLESSHGMSSASHVLRPDHHTNRAKLTSLCWINEHSDQSLLLTGFDDGVVRVWRDVLDDGDDVVGISERQNPSSPDRNQSSNGSSSRGSGSGSHSLASAFIALPDISESSARGSGMLTYWQQQNGVLGVAGNSSTIRLWDLSREQCVRAFHTQMDTCVTALTGSAADALQHGNVRSPTWMFAGFADGSVGVFDERMAEAGGRVMCTREHSSWVIASQLLARTNDAQIISASVNGTVKFWDVRKFRVFKTVEALKAPSQSPAPLTAMAVHNSAPLLACGSQAQLIKIMTLSGEQLGVIRYHEGFLGQRIGAISAVAFHPFQVMLAAAATDNIVSIYSTSDSQ